MLLCLQAVDSYKQSPKFAGFEGHAGRIALHNVINSVFNQDLDVFREQGEERRRQREEAKTFAKLYQEELAQLADLSPPEEEAEELLPLDADTLLPNADIATNSPQPNTAEPELAVVPPTSLLLPLTLVLLPEGDARLKLAF
jgi:hypothetical protein